jgi:sugar phosphate permease
MNVKNILNGAALLIGMVGIYFKSQWWAGADLLMLVGFGLLFISAVAFTISENNAAGTSTALSFVMVATLALGILGLVFKTMNWKGGFALSVGAGGLLLLLSLLLIVAKSVSVSRQFITVFAIWFTLVAAWLNVGARNRPASAPAVTMEEPAQ